MVGGALGAHLGVREDVTEGNGSFVREGHVGIAGVGARSEREGAMVQHLLGEVGGVDMRLDTQVAEHGVGFPAAEELDPGRVGVGTHQCGSATGAKAAGTEELPIDAGRALEGLRAMAEAIGDESGGHFAGLVGVVVVGVERSGRGCVVIT